MGCFVPSDLIEWLISSIVIVIVCFQIPLHQENPLLLCYEARLYHDLEVDDAWPARTTPKILGTNTNTTVRICDAIKLGAGEVWGKVGGDQRHWQLMLSVKMCNPTDQFEK